MPILEFSLDGVRNWVFCIFRNRSWFDLLLEYQFTGIPTCLLINTRICNKEDVDMVSWYTIILQLYGCVSINLRIQEYILGVTKLVIFWVRNIGVSAVPEFYYSEFLKSTYPSTWISIYFFLYQSTMIFQPWSFWQTKNKPIIIFTSPKEFLR